MYDISIKVKNYKCFKEAAGFDEILRVNLIIGKNNSGKSSLLDIIEVVCLNQYQFDQVTWRDNQRPQVRFTANIPEDIVGSVFSNNTSHGVIHGNHGEYGRQLIGRQITWSKRRAGNDRTQAELINCNTDDLRTNLKNAGDYSERLCSRIPIPLEGKKFRRVLSERDILKEGDDGDLSIQPNGSGITRAIQRFINRSNLQSDVVEIKMLEALNEIFAHDAIFTDIVCQLHDSNHWEIFLEEQNKGRIALSKSGSGLKTVITVLSCIFLVPVIEKTPLSSYVFGFEELENNIHPALLRRLNDYIYQCSLANDFLYFLTTHSNVLIDQFSKQDDAQIIHVTQKDAKAQAITVKTYIENNGILDDLDVRASDLLQANGIIWVEGPSDRVYLNRWIDLWSNGSLKEGTHYQIVFYGGRLLSHLSADTPDTVEEGISILRANRNAIIMIDSDKRSSHTRINPTKKRIRSEFEELGAMCWITKGKEIENYIPSQIVDQFWEFTGSPQVEQYSSFFDYLDRLKAKAGGQYLSRKSLLAEKLVQHMSIEIMRPILDLDEKMNEVCERIQGWNS